MADFHEPDVGTANYRSKDPIKNLKIKVCLSRVTSIQIVPQSQMETELPSGGIPMKDFDTIMKERDFGGSQDTETMVFKWQEKKFSQREVELYSNVENCTTVLERKYHEETAVLAEVGRPNKRLFSYVDHDTFTNTEDNSQNFTTDPNETPTLVAEKMSKLKYRRNTAPRRNDLAVVPTTNLIDYDPSEERKRQNHYICSAVQTMYIVVDCSPSGITPIEADEVVICTIKMDANGVLSIKPDFNKGKKSYKVESGLTRAREMFEYSIEHCSSQPTRQEQERESKMFRELYGRHQQFLAACVGQEFETPPADYLRLLVSGEIVSASMFEYNDLYISYHIEVPDDWMPNGQQKLQGVTHTCRTKRIGRNDVAYFGLPFNFELIYRSSSILKSEEEKMPQAPQIYFEVSSYDWLQRHRVEGYGTIMVPMSPGMSRESVTCWRPLGKSCLSEVRRYFIGGAPELEEPTYVTKPSTFRGSHLSKYGFRTTMNGKVNVHLNVMQQSQAFLQDQESRKKVGHVLDRIGYSSKQANILNVIEAFQQAKHRMVAARDNLKSDYVDTLKAQTDSD